MKRTENRISKWIFPLLTIWMVILIGVNASYAGDKVLGAAGQTGYDLVRYTGDAYLTTDYGKFIVSEETAIYDQDAEEIEFKDIKKNSMVDIQYVRVNGQFAALEIIAKIEKEEELPE